MSSSFTTLDYLIVSAYLVASVAIGLWFTRRQKSLEDYFVASRSAPWWAVGISIIATNLSAITYMGSPAYVYKNDLQLDVAILFFPLIMLLVVYLFVPFLAKMRLFTIYEYLEHRFGLSVRTLASVLFLAARGGWLATAIHTQSLAMSEITGLDVWQCIWLVGGVTALYTIFGGIEAVLWTDVMQFFVLVGGIFAMLAAVLIPFGGNLVAVWNLAAQGGHTRLFSFDFNLVGITVWAVVISNVVGNLCSYGSDQVVVQRYLTTGSRREMARAVTFNGLLVVPVVLLLDLVGVGFVAYYKTHPELAATLTNPDRIVPHFVTNRLMGGLAGVVIAGIFAANMSSLSSGFNSLSTATMVDFFKRFNRIPKGANELGFARWITVAWSLGSTTAAMFVGSLGSIVEIIGKISGFFSGPLLGMFLLGLLTQRANSFGVLCGAILGTAATWCISYTKVHWLWYSPVGCVVTVGVGYALSCVAQRQRKG